MIWTTIWYWISSKTPSPPFMTPSIRMTTIRTTLVDCYSNMCIWTKKISHLARLIYWTSKMGTYKVIHILIRITTWICAWSSCPTRTWYSISHFSHFFRLCLIKRFYYFLFCIYSKKVLKIFRYTNYPIYILSYSRYLSIFLWEYHMILLV